MKTKMSLLAIAIAMLLITGCGKDPVANLTDEESRIYITDHDSSANFSDFHTFYVSDSVAVLENGKSKMQLTEAGQAYIDAVKQAMIRNGYTAVNKDQHPDIGITVNRIISTTTGVISGPSYWDMYGSYWDPYFWGYPGYGYYLPYNYAVYSIREGAVSLDMIDLKNAPESGELKVIWTGLIRGSNIYNPVVADSQVKALFDQSPYIKSL
ncbi:MAG: DUF4136 domain-containing protein [Chitinophagaceae bacterium]|nr:DUF4136 domain-containing protein [Chitinophagaceae bacterium]MCW5913918.1 DUF4136 domain-containing protein [Chitinophagaceae bacterium]MCZ2397971.1 DUF4136 domain-containing protein [Chitinophagales bacterium]